MINKEKIQAILGSNFEVSPQGDNFRVSLKLAEVKPRMEGGVETASRAEVIIERCQEGLELLRETPGLESKVRFAASYRRKVTEEDVGKYFYVFAPSIWINLRENELVAANRKKDQEITQLQAMVELLAQKAGVDLSALKAEAETEAEDEEEEVVEETEGLF